LISFVWTMLLWIPESALPAAAADTEDDAYAGVGILPGRVEPEIISVYWTNPSPRSFVVSFACDGSHLSSTNTRLPIWRSSSFYDIHHSAETYSVSWGRALYS
jgi:hypothetical protein